MSAIQTKGEMMNCYITRLSGIKGHLEQDGNRLRFSQELQRLELDVTRAIRRSDAEEPILQALLVNVDNLMRGDLAC